MTPLLILSPPLSQKYDVTGTVKVSVKIKTLSVASENSEIFGTVPAGVKAFDQCLTFVFHLEHSVSAAVVPKAPPSTAQWGLLGQKDL